MLSIKKILLPVDIPITSLDVIHQAAMLARHFHSEIVMLHVVTPLSHAAGVPEDNLESTDWDLLTEVIKEAEKRQDESLVEELKGLPIGRLLVKGEPAWAIVRVGDEEKVDLIMMPSHGATSEQFLLGSVATKVYSRTGCPIWTGAHVDQPPSQRFTIRNVLCAVDLGPRSKEAISWAAPMAAEFGARLTLAHVTPKVEFWGPGGSYVDRDWKKSLVDDASQRIAKLQQDTGINADVFIGSGDVPTVLSQAAAQTKADLLVNGCYPYGTHLRTNGYAIICAVPIPVLSV